MAEVIQRTQAFVEYLQTASQLPPRLAGHPPATNDPALLREALERVQLDRDELVMAEEELRVHLDVLTASTLKVEQTHAQYRDLFEQMTDAVFVSNLQAVVAEANPAAAALLSTETPFLKGKPMVTLVDRDDRARFLDCVVSAAAPKGVRVSLRLLGRRDTPVEVTLHGRPSKLPGTLLWWVHQRGGGSLDREAELVRSLQETRAALSESQAEAVRLAAEVKTKDHAISLLSHELRGPLNVVSGWVRMLKTGAMPTREVERAFGLIEKKIKQQASLIDDLLDMARLNQDKVKLTFDKVDVGTVVAEVVQSLGPSATEHELTLTCEVPVTLRVLGEHRRLVQVLTNLVGNAIKFTPPGGRIAITGSLTRNAVGAGLVTLSVRDTGRGLKGDELETIFNCFHQGEHAGRRAHGLGLGLFLVRQILVLHGATVRAESGGPDLGTTFTVEFPAFGASEPPPPVVRRGGFQRRS